MGMGLVGRLVIKIIADEKMKDDLVATLKMMYMIDISVFNVFRTGMKKRAEKNRVRIN